ncbi:MAG TPA: hypothetical protein PLX04_00975 [Caldisericia bacterium]|nr:hypothetical protein [Caldisericia bacterium]HPL88822.1 hypothetical protein [Caldisericia bacterium]HQG59930.1 hypothetical protein [Caldisericia bacterium]HQH48516.1 hypothetical protein [Caldisericia bacterium]HQJ44449.1 hypothetical protein [Caldisericia bacterium]
MNHIKIIVLIAIMALCSCSTAQTAGLIDKKNNPSSSLPPPIGNDGLWSNGTQMIAVSGGDTEYLSTQTKWLLNKSWDAEQWMYGSWENAKLVDGKEASYAINKTVMPWLKLYERGAQWVYGCNPYYSWNNPPPTKLNAPDIIKPGKPLPPERTIQTLPSYYRHFFKVSSKSSGFLTIWVSGEVDVYLDPPVGTRLVKNSTSKSYLGSYSGIDKESGNVINLPLINPGAHCIYFVHRSDPYSNFFGMIFGLETFSLPGQKSACGWDITNGDCACAVSNETAEYLVHNDSGNNPASSKWEVFGLPKGTEWVNGNWAPVTTIPWERADNDAWGVDVQGAPWRKLYDMGANWITHIPSGGVAGMFPPGNIGWNSCPKNITNIYRQAFTVDKHCTAELTVYTNDDVDIYIDPFISIPNPGQSTKLVLQSPTFGLSNPPHSNQPETSYYYIGRADKQRRGMIVNLQIVLTPGTHTIYFVHRNSFDPKPGKTRDYYGLLYALSCKGSFCK